MNKISSLTADGLNALAALWAFALAFVILADVVGRCFGHALQGTAEIVANSIVAIVFLQFPLAIQRGRFLCATLLYDLMPGPAKALLDIAAYLLGFALFLAIAVGGWSDMITGFRIGEFEGEGALRVPVYPVRAVIFGMSLLSAAMYLLFVLRSVSKVFAAPPRSVAIVQPDKVEV